MIVFHPEWETERKLLPCMSMSMATEHEKNRCREIICIKNWNGSLCLYFMDAECTDRLTACCAHQHPSTDEWELSSGKQSEMGWVYLRHLWKTLIRYPYKRAAIQHWWCLFRGPHHEHTHTRAAAASCTCATENSVQVERICFYLFGSHVMDDVVAANVIK